MSLDANNTGETKKEFFTIDIDGVKIRAVGVYSLKKGKLNDARMQFNLENMQNRDTPDKLLNLIRAYMKHEKLEMDIPVIAPTFVSFYPVITESDYRNDSDVNDNGKIQTRYIDPGMLEEKLHEYLKDVKHIVEKETIGGEAIGIDQALEIEIESFEDSDKEEGPRPQNKFSAAWLERRQQKTALSKDDLLQAVADGLNTGVKGRPAFDDNNVIGIYNKIRDVIKSSSSSQSFVTRPEITWRSAIRDALKTGMEQYRIEDHDGTTARHIMVSILGEIAKAQDKGIGFDPNH